MTIQLYHALFSTCSQKVRLCLAEKNLQWESHVIDLYKSEQLSESYLKLNPNGVVPTLVHDGSVITDSSVIIEYLDEVFPGRPLSPQNPVERAHMRAWMRFFEEVPTAAIRVPSFRRVFARHFSGHSKAQLDLENSKRSVRKDFIARLGSGGFSSEDEATDLARLDLTLSRMEKRLDGHDWLVGNDISLAELVILPTIVRMEDLNLLDSLCASYPATLGWYRRLCQRPSFDTAFMAGSRDLVVLEPEG